jgi:hypothetical protein
VAACPLPRACASWAEGRPPAAGLGGREAWRGDDGGRRTGSGLGLPPHAARAVGIPAIVPRGDVDMDQHPGVPNKAEIRAHARRVVRFFLQALETDNPRR